jgi:outer membrane receptor protein involved in Fe transport
MPVQLKKITILILGLMLYSNFSLYGQTDNSYDFMESQLDPKTQKLLLTIITIDLENMPFEEALKVISDKGNFKLNYNRNRIPVDKKVSVTMDNVPAIEALLSILNDTGTALQHTEQGLLAVIPSPVNNGEIKGIVVEEKSGKSLARANVIVVGKTLGAATDLDGRFLIPELPAGVYSIEASMMGYASKRINNIIITKNTSVKLSFELADTLISLRTIIVTPGHFSLMEKEPISSKSLVAEDIRSFPQIGEDIYRAINRLPGVTGNDVSAKFNIRGGEYDETLVLLDGMELYDPFHLKDLDGFFSIIDIEAIRSIDMMTGAFPAEYGNRLSGVFDMRTVNPSSDNSVTSLALSFLNVRFLTQGGSSNGKWQWLVLARKGYLDLLLKWLNPEDKIEPVYYDVLSKFQYSINSRHYISAYILAANDDVVLTETDDGLEFNTTYGNAYGWLNWHAQLLPKLITQTVLSYGRVTQQGNAQQIPIRDAEFEGEVRVERNFDFFGLKQDWSFELSDHMMLRWGFAAKHLKADYDLFFRKPIIIDHQSGNEIYEYETTIKRDNPDGTKFGVYIANRFRLSNPFTMEFGVRYDHASWTKDKNISPRISMVYDLGKETVIRMGWGRYYQTQGINKLNVLDGDKRFYPAELAEHRVVGLEHEFQSGINLRVEAYQKKLSNIRPRYHNFRGFTLNPLAEIHDDRIRVEPEGGESRGFEIYIKKDRDDKFSWWASYSYAVAEDVIDGLKIPRDFDQRHTIYLDLNYHPNKKWRLNLAWQFHSGWPYTESILNVVQEWPDGYIDYDWLPGPLNAQRLPNYHRLDIRATRVFYTSYGRISTFLEIRNLYNRKNIREYIYEYGGYLNDNHVAIRTGTEALLPLLPSFGISLEF